MHGLSGAEASRISASVTVDIDQAHNEHQEALWRNEDSQTHSGKEAEAPHILISNATENNEPQVEHEDASTKHDDEKTQDTTTIQEEPLLEVENKRAHLVVEGKEPLIII